ncbi:2090_t:CDS:2 [Racocetra fulgida]|uniref:2090_t:CDS:1 n=1 Tax=Racocetra fulgida TaxID=60492 RepID=A0A9N8Z1P5_9GLOM|nr:2090_t:CDS:2 [Racocetra fulgida]
MSHDQQPLKRYTGSVGGASITLIGDVFAESTDSALITAPPMLVDNAPDTSVGPSFNFPAASTSFPFTLADNVHDTCVDDVLTTSVGDALNISIGGALNSSIRGTLATSIGGASAMPFQLRNTNISEGPQHQEMAIVASQRNFQDLTSVLSQEYQQWSCWEERNYQQHWDNQRDNGKYN